MKTLTLPGLAVMTAGDVALSFCRRSSATRRFRLFETAGQRATRKPPTTSMPRPPAAASGGAAISGGGPGNGGDRAGRARPSPHPRRLAAVPAVRIRDLGVLRPHPRRSTRHSGSPRFRRRPPLRGSQIGRHHHANARGTARLRQPPGRDQTEPLAASHRGESGRWPLVQSLGGVIQVRPAKHTD